MVTYCTAKDVQTRMQRRKPFSNISSPTKDQVDDIIEQVEDDINSQTGHAWKETQVTDRYVQHYTFENRFYVFDLGNRKVKELNSVQGDKIEVYINGTWENYLETKTFGKENDYWINYDMGLLYIRRYTCNSDEVRVTFRFGDGDVPGNIRKLASIMATIEVLQMYEQAMTLPEDGSVDRIPQQTRIDNLNKQADTIMLDVSEWKSVY